MAGPVQTFRAFFCGDVMLGRGIDQIMPHPVGGRLYEPAARLPEDYVRLAERKNGKIPRGVPPEYVWGDALAMLERVKPELSIINLETSITRSEAYEPKGINYRMDPANVGAITAAGIDCCALANNHALDWGVPGLMETLATLSAAGVAVAGAGRDRDAARRPAVVHLAGGGRALVFAMATRDSGVPDSWAARRDSPGVWLLPGLDDDAVAAVAGEVEAWRQASDVVVASIHWGPNWGYDIGPRERRFAHALVDRAGVDLVHGHSSHHPRGIELYDGRLILHGCGDFINDYEGIGGYHEYRNDLVVAYLPEIERGTGRCIGITVMPYQLHRFRLRHASPGDRRHLLLTLDRESRRLGYAVTAAPGGGFELARAR